MKVGGNESATKYFQSHGGSAALASKDTKVKYTCNAAVKYKEELKRRAAMDAQQSVDLASPEGVGADQSRFPEEVVVTDLPVDSSSDGANTPAGDPDDDFFSSWDKPSIKRPSNPPSRTGTPPVVSRTASPFLNAGAGANANGSRSKSPLSASEETPTSPAPAAIRASAATRKPAAGGAKKGSVLGAKKAPKLGAKKVVSADTIDFDEAERKAREEAERIEKLGYDPEAEQAEQDAKVTAAATSTTTITSPTPISPSRAGKSHERNSSDVERLGMGIGRLGFGQVSRPAAAPAPKKPGFGSVGPARTPADGMVLPSLRAHTD
jgi:ADP-ribosylation factor GTPase-activating protein 2/3